MVERWWRDGGGEMVVEKWVAAGTFASVNGSLREV